MTGTIAIDNSKNNLEIETWYYWINTPFFGLQIQTFFRPFCNNLYCYHDNLFKKFNINVFMKKIIILLKKIKITCENAF